MFGRHIFVAFLDEHIGFAEGERPVRGSEHVAIGLQGGMLATMRAREWVVLAVARSRTELHLSRNIFESMKSAACQSVCPTCA